MKVYIGLGAIDNFTHWIEGDWPVIPRVGETITICDPQSDKFGHHVVKDIVYQTGIRDELAGAIVLV